MICAFSCGIWLEGLMFQTVSQLLSDLNPSAVRKVDIPRVYSDVMDVRLNRLFFRATSSGTLPRYSGGMARGMLFAALKNYDKHIAQEIHDQSGVQTYALSGFRTYISPGETLSVMDKQLGIERRRKRDSTIRAGDILYFDVATASEKLQRVLPETFEQSWVADKTNVTMEPLQIREAEVEGILLREIPKPFTVKFITPLSFSAGPTYWVWPEVRYLMKNLTSIWNAWFPGAKLDAESILEKYANRVHVVFAEGRVLSANAAKGMRHTGWVGSVRYDSDDDETHGVFTNLIKLGFITGVGRGRTAGLGRFYLPKVLHSDRIVKVV